MGTRDDSKAADPKQTAHTPLEITRYVNYDARKRWEIELGEWQEDSSVHVSREKRDAFWFLLELKSAEEIVGKLKNSHDKLVEALEAAENALKEMAAWHGGTHEDDCSCDDTCECRHRPFNERVNNAINGAEAALRAAKEE